MSTIRNGFLACVVPLLLLPGCTTDGILGGDSGPAAAPLAEQARAIFGVLPAEAPNADNPITEAKVELGRMLYFDPRLSKNHDLSCNSCHALDRFGVDNEPTSPGHKGARGARNSPTSYNAAFHVAQFWDGRAADVEEQAGGPMMNPVEMAMPGAEQVEALLRTIPGYRSAFLRAFPDDFQSLSFPNAQKAIGAFERRLVTPSRFDAFMGGDLEALTGAERRGLEKFISTGCITCHAGPVVGGQMFQKIGLVNPYPTGDLGRYEVTGKESDLYVFKVPSLRNVAETGPWFHDGSVTSLEEAVRLMAHHQLGRQLEAADVDDLVAFLNSLTGTPDPDYIARPELPKSSPDTPGPDPS